MNLLLPSHVATKLPSTLVINCMYVFFVFLFLWRLANNSALLPFTDLQNVLLAPLTSPVGHKWLMYLIIEEQIGKFALAFRQSL